MVTKSDTFNQSAQNLYQSFAWRLCEKPEICAKVTPSNGEIVEELTDDQVNYLFSSDETIEKKVAFIFACFLNKFKMTCLEAKEFQNLTRFELDSSDLLSGAIIDKQSLQSKTLRIVVESFLVKIAFQYVDISLTMLNDDKREEFVYKVRPESDLIIRGLNNIEKASYLFNNSSNFHKELFEKFFSDQLQTHKIELIGGGKLTFSLEKPLFANLQHQSEEELNKMDPDVRLSFLHMTRPALKIRGSEPLGMKFTHRDRGQSSSSAVSNQDVKAPSLPPAAENPKPIDESEPAAPQPPRSYLRRGFDAFVSLFLWVKNLFTKLWPSRLK